ncbi:hypothetical protein [Dietzia sp. WMMA184]|uniref:hypothetical protein n=1 Tax=Dietzia sp. WMMA184 TaxID=2039808 RepID=UPI000BDF3462|nr:hypothetical protein [Dietzia sp. WMMA184]
MPPSRRPLRATFKASAVALTAALLVTTAGTPLAGGQNSGSLDTDSLSPGTGSSGSLGSAGSSGGDEIELVGPDAAPLWPNGRPVEHSIVPKAETTTADPGTVMSVTGGTGDNQSTVITPDQDDLPTVGDPFVVDVAPGSPVGVLGRVTGLTTLPSGLVQVTTEPADIDEVYDEFSINTTVRLEDAVSTDGGSGTGPMGRMQARSGASMPFRGLGSHLVCEDSVPVDFDVDLNIADMSAQVVFNPLDKYLKIVMTYEQSVEFSLSYNDGFECHVPPERMPRALLPLAGPLGLQTGPALEIEGGSAITLSATSRSTRSDGIEISDERSRAISDADYSLNEISLDAGAEATVFLGIKAEIAADIAAVRAAAGVSAGPEFTGSLNSRDCAELTASIRLAATVSASAFWTFRWTVNIVLARIGFLSLIIECGSTGTTTTRPTGTTTTTPTTTTSAPPPGFQDGAITNLVVGQGLNCDVQSPTDGRSVYYGPGACATIAFVDGQSYGTAVPASGGFNTGWTPVAQSTTGSVTAADPLVIRTTVRAGDTGIELTQVDYFVDGSPGYQTDITVRNSSGVAKDVTIYRAVDCYLSRSDYGTGSVYSRSVSCNDNSGRRIAFTDLTGGALRQESSYGQIWDVARTGADYSDTSLSTEHDNGMGINWNRTIPVGGSAILRSRFQLDEPVNPANGRAAARIAPLGAGPDVKRDQPTEGVQNLPTSVPTS